jgi:putative acetyltransferase
MIIQQVLPTNSAVVALIEKLNHYQIGLYGLAACNLEPPEVLQKNNAFMVGAYLNDTLTGIGGVKLMDGYAEIKRMYVEEKYRGGSVAVKILNALQEYVKQKGISEIFLETGYLQHSAIKFYKNCGYHQVESFGKNTPNGVSVYFGKVIQPAN